MTVTIKNELLTVEIEHIGAQVRSVLGADGTQYIWEGDPKVWGKHAPLLFPVIGRLKNGQYLLEGKAYQIGIHGFARDAEFTAVGQSEQEVSFQLAGSEATYKVFPFDFLLTVTYVLEKNTLIKRHRVENRSQWDMLYELGGHDGFRVPLNPGEKVSDYSIVLPGVEVLEPYEMDNQYMMAPKSRSIPLSEGKVNLHPMEYGLDTVVVDRPPRGTVLLLDGSGSARITMCCADFDYLGIWTVSEPLRRKFVCLEPWTTLPDAVFCGRELSEKAGIRRLAPGTAETLTYSVTFR